MPALKWNLCTSFAAIGAVIAYAILFALFGFHWQLVPAAAAGLAAAYLASTVLGELALRFQLGRFSIASTIVGVGFAWCTLFAGTLAISLTNFVVAVIDRLAQAPSGQPVLNVLAEILPGYAQDLIKTPLAAGMLFGLLPGAVLGIVYGVLLRARFDKSLAEATSAGKWVMRASAATVLLVFLLGVALIVLPGVPGSKPTIISHPAHMPIALRECGERKAATGVTAYCRGSPCERGVCDWEVELDAFEVHVRPPVGSTWEWSGGGIGTGRRRDLVTHNIYWVQFEPDGSLNQGSPRYHARYEMVFEGNFVKIGAQRFRFEPGMQLDIQFLEDWSVTARAGNSTD